MQALSENLWKKKHFMETLQNKTFGASDKKTATTIPMSTLPAKFQIEAISTASTIFEP
jgi:hypothetical protein